MTIQNTTLRKAGPSQGNGVTTVFPFTFKVFTATDILVTYLNALAVESVLVLTTNYTVSLNADQNTSPGGSVTLLVAPATATYITLTSQLANTQTLALTNSGGFYPESINNALDRTVIEIQQLAEQASRAVTIPKSSTASPLLPSPAANNVLVWNNAATALTNLPATTGTSLVNLAAYTGSTLVGTTNGGTGSVTRTVASKLNDTVSVKDFGAVGDGVTDDTAAIQAAMASLGTMGGTVTYTDRHLILSTLLIPKGVTLKGPKYFNAGNTGYDNPLAVNGSALLLSSSATIILNNNAGILNTLIYRSDMHYYAVSSSGFAGTCVTAAGNDVFLSGCFIAGFNQAFISNGFERIKLIDVYGDCQNGVSITTSNDKTYLCRVHFWPFVTQQSGLPASAQYRTGSAFYFSGNNAYTSVVDCFSYGYFRGLSISATSDISCIGSGFDGDSAYTGSIGILVSGSCSGNSFTGCRTSGQSDGVYINNTSTLYASSLTAHSSWGNTRGIIINQGVVNIIGGYSFSNTTGIEIGTSTAIASISGVAFSSCTTAIGAAVPNSHTVIASDCLYISVVTRRGSNVQSSINSSSVAIILSGTNSITFSHGLEYQPVYYTAVPVNTNLAGLSYWIGNATATQMTIYTSANVASNASFIWEARVYN